MEDNRDIDFRELGSRPGYLIRRLHQIHVALFLEECREHNLTPVQFGVLTVLYDGEALEQVVIAGEMAIDRNTAADVIRRLAKRGYIHRPASIRDRRAKLAQITERGREVVERMQPQMIAAQNRLVAPLDEDEYRQLMFLMGKVIDGNNEASRAPLRNRKPTASSAAWPVAIAAEEER